MKVELSEEVIEQSLASSVDTAVANAFTSYDVRRVIEQRIGEEVIGGALAKALTDAMDNIDMGNLTQALAEQLSRTVIASTVTLLRSQCVELIYKLRGHQEYEKDKDAIKAAIREELLRSQPERHSS